MTTSVEQRYIADPPIEAMTEMTKRKLNMLRSGRCRRWGAAVIAAALCGSGQLAVAQSVLRFKGPNDAPVAAATSLPRPIVATPEPVAADSEFRFVEMTEGKVAPLPQFTVSAREVIAGKQSTLKFAPAVPAQPSTVAAAEVRESGIADLRFKPAATPVASAPTPVPTITPVPSPIAVRPVPLARPL